jgi:hypothetical protein
MPGGCGAGKRDHFGGPSPDSRNAVRRSGRRGALAITLCGRLGLGRARRTDLDQVAVPGETRPALGHFDGLGLGFDLDDDEAARISFVSANGPSVMPFLRTVLAVPGQASSSPPVIRPAVACSRNQARVASISASLSSAVPLRHASTCSGPAAVMRM